MSELINAKGLNCPQPVILTKKAIETYSDIIVLVDNDTAVENIRRLASSNGCTVEVTEENGVFSIHLLKQANVIEGSDTGNNLSCDQADVKAAAGPTVIVFTSTAMGTGDEELGVLLMKSFIHTLLDIKPLPEFMIFYNAGVKLTVKDSDVIDDLKALEDKGVKILVCGTCVNFFKLTGQIGAGNVSNMYDIAGTLSRSGRTIKP
ncbi:MAG: sulfurtransferase-like selenium metabolism protein YedF [Desulfobacterium sp.]|nr:sulfurtransferase-like selenium metabolism protein YedF [Desulfobacterium sp.]MBU3948135.1 sulfurtransferase-like selenium metabolism protein YedF [Pseudomonadota bacterium]MBU4010906.1 sulfurtransferase-like selenium metabolism protein YedF [Pseudomonadota bacterium]MBU4036660.1 sulfurtransferase-like selenium metabolism protein YedF [Pseudomonadota bacterium]